MTLEQDLIEHSGASEETLKSIVVKHKEIMKLFEDNLKKPGDDHKCNEPFYNCCKQCPNNRNAFCNCTLPYMEMNGGTAIPNQPSYIALY